MKKNLFMSLVLVLFVTLPFAALEEDSVSGDWNVNIVSDHGEFAQAMTFKQEGNIIIVSYEDKEGEGTIEDNKIQWTITLVTPMGDMEASFNGTVSEDEISGDVEISGMAMEFTCERVKKFK